MPRGSAGLDKHTHTAPTAQDKRMSRFGEEVLRAMLVVVVVVVVVVAAAAAAVVVGAGGGREEG